MSHPLSEPNLLAINHLLSQAGTIRAFERELIRASGEGFNIFNILGIGHYEVGTHSPMLAELLNPEGKHGQGAIFLLRFLEVPDIARFDVDAAQVEREKHIGRKTGDEGGRVDILIKVGDEPKILIENKIYAGEQANQLSRYHAFAPHATLVFLTLHGTEPAGTGWKDIPTLKCFSYNSEHILK